MFRVANLNDEKLTGEDQADGEEWSLANRHGQSEGRNKKTCVKSDCRHRPGYPGTGRTRQTLKLQRGSQP